jgi:hypothetical protein
MSRVPALLLLLLLFWSLSARAFALEPPAQDATLVVKVDKTRAGFVTTVNSHLVAQGLLNALIQIDSRTINQAALFVHEDANLKMIANILGVMAKAGFPSPRIFYFGRDKDWLQELTYPSRFQYSEDINKLKELHSR